MLVGGEQDINERLSDCTSYGNLEKHGINGLILCLLSLKNDGYYPTGQYQESMISAPLQNLMSINYKKNTSDSIHLDEPQLMESL